MIRVFEYGARRPGSGEQAAIDQIYRRNRLWNALVEIERDIRTRWPAKEDPHRKTRVAELELERRARVKAAQAASDLYWCNYDEVITSYKLARVRAFKTGVQLRFHSSDGSGKVTVRYQTGLPVKEVFGGTDTRLQIGQVDRERLNSPVRAIRRKSKFTNVRLRVGSDDKRAPIWLESGLYVDRVPPEDAVVRCASAHRERIGNDFRWKLTLTVALPEQQTTAKLGAVAVDLGWRIRPDGLRVAYRSDGSESAELCLPPNFIEQWKKLDELKAIRDNHFNYTVRAVSNFLESTHPDRLPAPITEAATGLKLWKRQHRMAHLRRVWLQNRFEGDAKIVGDLEFWYERYRHLLRWECHRRDRMVRWRREIYRVWAAELVSRYGEIRLEDFELPAVYAEDQRPDAPVVRFNRFMASVSTLRLAIINAAEREGVRVVEVDPALTTQRCHLCGYDGKWDAAKTIAHRCLGCGAIWDQDYNACMNMLSQIGGDSAQNEDLRKLGSGGNSEAVTWQPFVERLQSPAHGGDQ